MAYRSKFTGAEVDSLLEQVQKGEVGGSVTVDSSLSTTSENPVMNKAITEELNKKLEGEVVGATSPTEGTIGGARDSHNIGSIDLFEQIIAQKQNHNLTLEDKEAILSGKVITTSAGNGVVPTISSNSMGENGAVLIFHFNERLYEMFVMWTDTLCYINGVLSFTREAKLYADSELSETSENSVQNKVVTEKLTELSAEVSELSNDVTGKSATLEKYDSSALTKGNYYDGTKATIEEAYSSASSWYSHLFPVKEGQTIHVVSDGNGKGIPAAILYAGSKMYELKFSNAYGQVDEIADFVIPQGVTHIAVNCYYGSIGSFELTIYTPSETGLNEVLDCFEKGKNLIDPTAIVKGKYLKPSNGLPTTYDTASISGFIPVIEGQTYIISGASRQSTGVAGYADVLFENPVKLTDRSDFYLSNNTPFVIPQGVKYIVLTLSLNNFDDIYNIMLNEGGVALPLDKYGLFLNDAQIEDIQGRISSGGASSESPFANKKIAFLGDSSTALPDSKYYPHSWVKVCCDIINPQSYKLYARSGSTLRTRYDENGTMQKCLLLQIQQMETEGYNPDIIMIQMGGNDISYMKDSSLVGTLADAKKMNYLQSKDILTMYGSIGYCIGYLKNKYPNALIVIGTVFQRTKTGIDTECEQVADIEKECAALFSLPVIDGFSESGISSQDECETATNFKCWDGMDEGQSAPDFGHPIFNYVNPTTGAILTKADGEADSSAIKVYGRYTWDGTHQKESGINKVGHYMAARLSAIVE